MKLSDTALVILNTAAQRDGGLLLPFPAAFQGVRGGAAKKVIGSLIAKGFVEETEAGRDVPVWRETGDGHGITLVITGAGLAAIGVEPKAAADTATEGATDAPKAKGGRKLRSRQKPDGGAPKAKGKAKVDPKAAPTPHTGTKQEKLISMLRTKNGASIDEIAAETGWKKHTVRGAIAGALKKKLGLDVQSEKVEGRGTVYKLRPIG